MLPADDHLQHRRLGGRDDLSLHRHQAFKRKTRISQRISLPYLWTRRAFGVICIKWRAEEPHSDVSRGHGADHCPGVLHQLDDGGHLPHALVGLFQLQVPAQRTHLPDQLHFLRPGLRAAVPCGEPAGAAVADGHRAGVHRARGVLHLRPVYHGQRSVHPHSSCPTGWTSCRRSNRRSASTWTKRPSCTATGWRSLPAA